MSRYRFRGKSLIDIEHMAIKTGDWVYGSYVDGYIINEVIEANEDYITIGSWVPVNPDTIGQWAGVSTDMGVMIFEGDVIESKVWFEDTTGGPDKHYTIQGDIKFGLTDENTEGSYARHLAFYIEWRSDGDKNWKDWLRQDIHHWLKEKDTKFIGNIHDQEE